MATKWSPIGKATLKRVGIREFRDQATKHLAAGEVLRVERHGKLIGFSIPVKARDDEEARQALERLNEAVERALAETGMTEEELSAAFDLSRPAPDAPGR